mgnify:CR=1 FL=1
MADHGFWNYAAKDPGALALVEPDGREWTRGELLASCNRIVHGLRALGLMREGARLSPGAAWAMLRVVGVGGGGDALPKEMSTLMALIAGGGSPFR